MDAANWLARRRGRAVPPAARALAGVLSDPLPPLRRAAINGLLRLEAGDELPALRALLESERDPTVLPALLISIGTLGAPAEDGERIDAFSQHPGPAVRAAALTGLARLPHRLARVRAMAALTLDDRSDPGFTMRAAALLALARAGEPQDMTQARAAYVEGDGQRFWFGRSAYARVLAALEPDPVESLYVMMQDPDSRVAVTAAEGLVRSGNTRTLLSLLAHADAAVRIAAIGGLEQARVVAAIPRLEARARGDTSRRVRWAAARALFRLEDELGDKLMLVGLSARQPAIWAEAIALLAERTGEAHGRDVEAWRGALRRWREARR